MDKIIDGVNVSECERHCSDNHNRPNKCYSDFYEGYRDCRPKEFKCNFYIKSIEQQLQRLQAKNERLKARLRPLEDSYFKGLSSIEIAELAKKSIRVTAENRKLEYALQEIRDMADFKCALPSTELCNCKACDYADNIIAKINEVIGAEE